MPDFSIRVDPFNALLYGRLGLELEVGLWKFISFEMVPEFVVNEAPPAFNLGSFPDVLTQHSNGLGSLSGSSFGVGFWLEGEPFEGYVLRAILTNYGYTYRTADAAGTIDEVSHTDRQLMGFFGSLSKFGPFVIGGGIGLGWELNSQKRCFTGTSVASHTSQCTDDELLIAISRNPDAGVVNLNSGFHPVVLAMRFSLGFAF
jgi:hypothetical protein